MLKSFDQIMLADYFNKCVKGYHMLNTEPIKEAVWESINSLVFKYSGIQIVSQACGSHSPGCDIETDIGKFSNKSAKYDAKCSSFSVSSYRLTSVTNSENPGTLENIFKEIDKRKNFDYYSVILREELENKGFKYDWYLIPSNYDVFNPSKFSWEPTIGKRGKNTGSQIGWNTISSDEGSMSITFSMSSQLWINVKVTEEMKKFIVATSTYDGEPPQIDYIMLSQKV